MPTVVLAALTQPSPMPDVPRAEAELTFFQQSYILIAFRRHNPGKP